MFCSGFIGMLSTKIHDINRNIDQDRSSTDTDIEILNINSPDYNTHDSEQYEASLNEAWRFINTTRHQKFTQNEGLQRNSREFDRSRMHNRHQITHENIKQSYINSPSIKKTTWNERARNRKRGRNFCFPTINDYLDALDNSSDDETPNLIEQNFLNIQRASQEAVEVYDGTIITVTSEEPMLIYSYKNKNYSSDANENLINSPNQESETNSTSSISVENFNEESVGYEKSFYRISTSFHPVIIPRLPLKTYMLPTVTEILEPNKQSPKITELSNEDHSSVKRKPTNGWVMNDNKSSHSDANNTTETNVENSTNELSPNNKEQSMNNNISSQYESRSKISKIKDDIKKYNSKLLIDLEDPKSAGNTTNNKYNKKEKLKQRNKYLDASDVIQVDSTSNKNIENDSIKSKYKNSSPVELSSVHSSILTLHLSLNTEAGTNNQSWFNRFIKCILCCK